MRFELADYKDIAAKDFLRELRKMQSEMVEIFDGMYNKLTYNQLIASIHGLEKFIIGEGLHFDKKVANLMLSYNKALEQLQMFAEVPETTLQALKSIDHQAFLNHSRMEVTAIQKEFLRRITTKTWNKKEVIESLRSEVFTALSDKQIETEITTALSNFERNVTANMMNEMPDDTKYYYLGARDDKVRDECRSMLSAGELTKKEIVKRFGAEVLEIGGGYNCRHRWSLAV